MKTWKQIDEDLAKLVESFDLLLQDATSEQEEPTQIGLPFKADFTANELKAWTENEPDFTKRIVTPLKGTKHQTRRYQHLLSGSVTSTFGKPRSLGLLAFVW